MTENLSRSRDVLVARVLLSAIVLGPWCGPAVSQTEADAAVASCPVTLVNGDSGGLYGNEVLDVALWPRGKWVFAPDNGGFVDSDGALGVKFGWVRKIKGNLEVGGRRLDGETRPARAYIPDGYGDIGFQSSYLVFPTPGCWQITGHVGDASLTFVVSIEQVGDGPTWRYTLPDRGWRVSSVETTK